MVKVNGVDGQGSTGLMVKGEGLTRGPQYPPPPYGALSHPDGALCHGTLCPSLSGCPDDLLLQLPVGAPKEGHKMRGKGKRGMSGLRGGGGQRPE